MGSATMDDKWRSATALDAVEIDGPASLDGLCKETGWAKIRQVHTPLNWAVDVFLAGGLVYESTEVSIYCAKAGAGAAPVVRMPPVAPTVADCSSHLPPLAERSDIALENAVVDAGEELVAHERPRLRVLGRAALERLHLGQIAQRRALLAVVAKRELGGVLHDAVAGLERVVGPAAHDRLVRGVGLEARDGRPALLHDRVEDAAERARGPAAVRRVVQVEDLVEHRLADRVRRDVERADEVVGDLPVVRVGGGRTRRDRAHEAEGDRLEAVGLRRRAAAAPAPRATSRARRRTCRSREWRPRPTRDGDDSRPRGPRARCGSSRGSRRPSCARPRRPPRPATSRRARARSPRPSGRPCIARRRDNGCAPRRARSPGRPRRSVRSSFAPRRGPRGARRTSRSRPAARAAGASAGPGAASRQLTAEPGGVDARVGRRRRDARARVGDHAGGRGRFMRSTRNSAHRERDERGTSHRSAHVTLSEVGLGGELVLERIARFDADVLPCSVGDASGRRPDALMRGRRVRGHLPGGARGLPARGVRRERAPGRGGEAVVDDAVVVDLDADVVGDLLRHRREDVVGLLRRDGDRLREVVRSDHALTRVREREHGLRARGLLRVDAGLYELLTTLEEEVAQHPGRERDRD